MPTFSDKHGPNQIPGEIPTISVGDFSLGCCKNVSFT